MKSSKVSSKKRVVFVCAGVGVLLAGLCIGLKALWPLSSSAPIYLLPHEDAKLVSPGTDVVIRAAVKLGAWNVTPALFKVVGDKSGAVAGEAILSDDDKTMLFKPAKPFTPGEAVTVDFVGGKLGAGGEKNKPGQIFFCGVAKGVSVCCARADDHASIATSTWPGANIPNRAGHGAVYLNHE